MLYCNTNTSTLYITIHDSTYRHTSYIVKHVHIETNNIYIIYACVYTIYIVMMYTSTSIIYTSI